MNEQETITITLTKQRYNEIQKIENEIISGLFDSKKDLYCVLNRYSYSSYEVVLIKNADEICKRIIEKNVHLEKQVKGYEDTMTKLRCSFWVRLGFLFNIK